MAGLSNGHRAMQSRLGLRLIACLANCRRVLAPTVRVNVDIDDCATALSRDLVLSVLRAIWSVDLHLELMRLRLTILSCHHRLGEVLRRVEVPRELPVVALQLLLSLGRAFDLRRVLKVLRVLRLPFALVGVGGRTQHVLGQRPSQIHLRLDFGRLL